MFKRYSLLSKKRGEVRFRLGYNATKDDFDLILPIGFKQAAKQNVATAAFFKPRPPLGMD
jgi:hypothetical protein